MIFPAKKKPKVAICVGHSRMRYGRREGGAYSVDETSEHEYNSALAMLVQNYLGLDECQSRIWNHYEGDSYGDSMIWIAGQVQKWQADCAIELHFNAAGPAATGHEWLYWKDSHKSEELASFVNTSYALAFPELAPRGIKPLTPSSRGASFCKYSPCPAIIAEPFFGTNKSDWKLAQDESPGIAEAIAAGIDEWLRS